MVWLFERTVELAAWVAMILAWIALGLSIYYLTQWIAALQSVDQSLIAPQLLVNSGVCAACFVGCALALGGLACVDRFLFDADETK
jgi:hypothetical protein